jgi:hypothetical protein
MTKTNLPEPPDGTRLEFEYCTDVFAAWRDDDSSARAGWPVGDGGKVWCLYGQTVPVTWSELVAEFSEAALRLAVRLVPIAEDQPNRAQWPTAIYAARIAHDYAEKG